MTDITRRATPADGSTYEAVLARAKDWMMDNYNEHSITLSRKEARKFEERATKARFNIAPPEPQTR